MTPAKPGEWPVEEPSVTPAEHGQEARQIARDLMGGDSETRAAAERRIVALVDRERALEESAAEFEAKYEQSAAETATLEGERRALVEALREIANWDYGGQPLRCNEMAQAALDRMGEGR